MARAFERELDCYSERHHVVPRAFGGSNDKTNIVRLTYREHFLAHWLLTKFTTGRDRIKMLHALHRMGNAESSDKDLIVAGWQYAVARKAQRDAVLGLKRSPETRAKMSLAQLGNRKGIGVPKSAESRAAIARSNKARIFTPEIRANLRNAQLGKKASPQTKAAMSKAHLGKVHLSTTKSKQSVARSKYWAERHVRAYVNLHCAVLSFGA